MKTSETFEDNWHDIVSKAMRGLQLDTLFLAQQSQVDELSIRSLIEKKLLNESTLVSIASTLRLDAQSLLDVARHPYHQTTVKPPFFFQCFTTSYHGMEVHSYLLWSEENKKAVAFDTGADLTPLLKTLEEHQLQLSLILLTHGHSDHVCQLAKLISTTGASAWIHEKDLLPQAKSFTFPHTWKLDSNITIEALPTPGHSPGGTTYVTRGISPIIAVAGDALFARSVGGIPPQHYKKALEAIQKNILSLPDETIIAPGHGPLTTVGEEKCHNPFLAQVPQF